MLALTGASAVSGTWFDMTKGTAGATFPVGNATSTKVLWHALLQ